MKNNEQNNSIEVTKESNLRVCKKCDQVKRRTLSGKYPDQRDKKWVDDSGKQWCGNYCPDCHRERAKETMAKKRAQKNVNLPNN